jgi:hypothetical protein
VVKLPPHYQQISVQAAKDSIGDDCHGCRLTELMSALTKPNQIGEQDMTSHEEIRKEKWELVDVV